MRILYGLIVALGVFAIGGFAFVYSGVYNVAATEEHSAIGKWAFHTAMENSVEARASDIVVPANLSNEEMIHKGALAYDQLCAACHLKPGQNDSLLRKGLNPTPPPLTDAGHFGPAEQFWIIKNGIKMTGMPAWGNTHDDKALWELTAFVNQLPKLSEQQYENLVQLAAESETADDGHNHDHGNMPGMMAAESSGVEPHHDSHSGHADGHRAEELKQHNGDQNSGKQPTSETESKGHYSDGHTH